LFLHINLRNYLQILSQNVAYLILITYFCSQNTDIEYNNINFGMDKIDNLDKKILSILSKNARIPFKDVAAECNVSRAAIHQRVQHLMENGIITGSGFDVNPKSLGYSTCTYVGLNLERGSMYKNVVSRLVNIPEIVECHFTTGPYTMLLKLYARDNEQLMDLLNNRLQSIPGVVSTETLISLEQSIKREIPVKIDDTAQ
jgi:Lrp/AsnC family transcriptional regulator for asnA, asnC and gidA